MAALSFSKPFVAVFYEFYKPLWLVVSVCLLIITTPFASMLGTWIFIYYTCMCSVYMYSIHVHMYMYTFTFSVASDSTAAYIPYSSKSSS